MLSPLRYSERLRRKLGLPEKDSTSEGNNPRTEEHRLGGPFLINLPAFTRGLSEASPLSLMWNNNGLAKDVRCIIENYHVEWYQISATKRRYKRQVEPEIDTILILAEKQNSNEKWLSTFKDIRTLCNSLGLPNMNIEIADGRALLPVFSFSVEATEPVLGKWPNLQLQVIEILGSQPWLAL